MPTKQEARGTETKGPPLAFIFAPQQVRKLLWSRAGTLETPFQLLSLCRAEAAEIVGNLVTTAKLRSGKSALPETAAIGKKKTKGICFPSSF